MPVTFRNSPPVKETSSLPSILRDLLPLPLLIMLEKVPGVWEELHLRVRRASSITVNGENYLIDTREVFHKEDMEVLLRRLCSDSFYAFRDRINEGYLTLPGGIRVGLGGHATLETKGEKRFILGVHGMDTVCFRFPHPAFLPGQALAARLRLDFPAGALIFSPPGVGKTTLLRALAVHFSSGEHPLRTTVIDSREELDDGTFDRPLCLSLLSGYPIGTGMEIATRSLCTQLILCDEIGNSDDACAILHAANCGVPVLASAHAASLEELLHRPAIRALHHAAVFASYVGIARSPDVRGEFSYTVTRRSSVA